MRRIFLGLALLLLAPASLPAVPITGYAIGQVTRDRSLDSPGSPPPHVFTEGEAVYLRFSYDLDPPSTPTPGWADVRFTLWTGSSFFLDTPPAVNTLATVDGEDLRLEAGRDPWSAMLRLTDGSGMFVYGRDMGSNAEGFAASLTRVADNSAFPTPEPSGLLVGLIGMVLTWGAHLCVLGAPFGRNKSLRCNG